MSGVPQRLKSTTAPCEPASRPPPPPSWIGLGRVLLEVHALEAHDVVAVGRRHGQPTAAAERFVVLADLVRLGRVGIEVVLAVERRVRRDLRAQREARPRSCARRPRGWRPAARPAAPCRPGRCACWARRRTRSGSGRTSCCASRAARGSRGRSRPPSRPGTLMPHPSAPAAADRTRTRPRARARRPAGGSR